VETGGVELIGDSVNCHRNFVTVISVGDLNLAVLLMEHPRRGTSAGSKDVRKQTGLLPLMEHLPRLKEAARTRGQSLHNSANGQRYRLRENAARSTA
jgi:hypothetical protein